MRASDIHDAYTLLRIGGDLAWLLGYQIGKLTRSKMGKR